MMVIEIELTKPYGEMEVANMNSDEIILWTTV